jgi:hypothetical protein
MAFRSRCAQGHAAATMSGAQPTELTLRLRHSPGAADARGGTTFAEFHISWPDGRPVQLGLSGFCTLGRRLLLGRRHDGDIALVRLTLHPVAGREAALTHPGSGARCRRLYALRRDNTIRLHFLDGTPAEAVFQAGADEPQVLRWLQAERMRPGEPFWFDLVSQTLAESAVPFEPDGCVPGGCRTGRPGPAAAERPEISPPDPRTAGS